MVLAMPHCVLHGVSASSAGTIATCTGRESLEWDCELRYLTQALNPLILGWWLFQGGGLVLLLSCFD